MVIIYMYLISSICDETAILLLRLHVRLLIQSPLTPFRFRTYDFS